MMGGGNYLEREVFAAFLQLTAAQRKVIQAFAKANTVDGGSINRLLKYLFCTEKLAETRVPDPLPA